MDPPVKILKKKKRDKNFIEAHPSAQATAGVGSTTDTSDELETEAVGNGESQEGEGKV